MNNTKKKCGELTADEICEIIDQRIHKERDRDILKRNLLDGVTYQQIANEFHLSLQGVKKIAYKSLDKIAKYI